MAKVLTDKALISCNHQGTVQVTATQQKLLVGGAPALVDGDLDGSTVTGCMLQSPATPCASVASTTGGTAGVLTAAGKPVLLDTATGTTNSGTWSVSSAGQPTLDAG